MIGALLVAVTIVLTVYAQLVIKWQVGGQQFPETGAEKLFFVLKQLLNPWILSGFAAAFLASLSWMAAITKLRLSDAYPFTSLSLVLVVLLSHICFDEPINSTKVLGTGIIVLGLIIMSR